MLLIQFIPACWCTVVSLTHWGRNKMAAIFAEDNFICIFLNANFLLLFHYWHIHTFLYIWINVDINMSLYLKTHNYTFPLFNSLLHSLILSKLTPMQTLWYFAKDSWVRLDCHLVLVNNNMFVRICFKHIVFTGLLSDTGLLYGPLYVFHCFSKTFNCIWYRISYLQLNYYLARLGPCDYIFRHW